MDSHLGLSTIRARACTMALTTTNDRRLRNHLSGMYLDPWRAMSEHNLGNSHCMCPIKGPENIVTGHDKKGNGSCGTRKEFLFPLVKKALTGHLHSTSNGVGEVDRPWALSTVRPWPSRRKDVPRTSPPSAGEITDAVINSQKGETIMKPRVFVSRMIPQEGLDIVLAACDAEVNEPMNISRKRS